jgi:CO/xanthine dehydrogenase Mo-binding subunit
MLQAAVLRSPHAHARLGAIRTRAALDLPGVAAVVTARDLGGIGRIPMRLAPRPGLVECLQPPLAREKVRYVGEPVAVVFAEGRYVAEDAVELGTPNTSSTSWSWRRGAASASAGSSIRRTSWSRGRP